MEDGSNRFSQMVVKDEQAELVGQLFACFLEQYTSDGVVYDYMEQIKIMRESSKTSIYIDWQQISDYNIELATEIEREYYRYEPTLKNTVEKVYYKALLEAQLKPIAAQRSEFWVHFYNLPLTLKLRELRSGHVGKLRAFGGTVTRTSEVRPELMFGVFVCLDCGKLQLPVEQHFCYTEPPRCIDQTCANSARWQLDMSNSTFVDWQKIHVQESPNEIPSGSMPRHIDVILRQDAVEQARAGDRCIFVGTPMVVPDVSVFKSLGNSVTAIQGNDGEQGVPEGGVTGLKSIGVRELTYKLIFVANTVTLPSGMLNLPEVDDEVFQLRDDEKEMVFAMKNDPQIYKSLSKSIAPTIFGHDEVKKGLLLMLSGGIQKETLEGTRLRGDINVCIVGDPSVAKSQFLKYMLTLVPRAVYTSGKASTAAGLTATVVRDSDTNDYNIEAGALMLADSSICCIDEFDKMEHTDQVAIHEAMEQQTISIAKAGIHATLNARTSILAAANPIGGRYDKSRSLKSNIIITPAIMSRFDLLFVILDKNDVEIDSRIARHIILLHQEREQTALPVFSQKQIQTYLKFAKKIKPQFGPGVAEKLVKEYCALRASDQGRGRTAWRITVRQLESMIRLSEALARIHLQKQISIEFVEEAVRLLRQSIICVCSEDVEIESKPASNPLADSPRETEQAAPLKKPTNTSKTLISREDYEKAKNVIISCIQKNASLNSNDKSCLQDNVVKWYLEACSDYICGHKDLKYQKALAHSIINKIITNEKLLYVVKDSNKKGSRLLALRDEGI